MKHFLIVLSIILLASLPFLFPSIENAQDGSFNDYEYLQKLRRTRSDINSDDKDKGWQEDGTFKSWYQKGNGSEDDKALNNIKTPSNVPVPSNTVPSTISVVPIKTNTSKSSSDETTNETKPGANIVPYLLLVLLLMIIILVFYIKYNYV